MRKISLEKNWITRFLNRHPVLSSKFANRIDRQRSYASNPCIILEHFWKLGNIIRKHNIKPQAIANMDEKGFVMGYSKRTKVLTRRGRKNPRVKQDGNREFITAIEAVAADGYVFPSFLIEKGKKHHIGWYQNVNAEDEEAFFAVSPKGWTDDKLALWWLVNVYDPYSKQRLIRNSKSEKRLLILDGHGSHISFDFIDFCEKNNIVVYCLPPHSTHLLQPLDVGLFGPLQHHYSKAVEDYFLTTDISINRATFFPLFKNARRLAYNPESIQNAFRACGIVPLCSKAVTDKLQAPKTMTKAISRADYSLAPGLAHTPHTKSELRQQTALALSYVKTSTTSEICNLILRFSHTAEFALTGMDIVTHDMTRLRTQHKIAKPHKKDMRQLKGGRVLTGKQIRALANRFLSLQSELEFALDFHQDMQ